MWSLIRPGLIFFLSSSSFSSSSESSAAARLYIKCIMWVIFLHDFMLRIFFFFLIIRKRKKNWIQKLNTKKRDYYYKYWNENYIVYIGMMMMMRWWWKWSEVLLRETKRVRTAHNNDCLWCFEFETRVLRLRVAHRSIIKQKQWEWKEKKYLFRNEWEEYEKKREGFLFVRVLNNLRTKTNHLGSK